MNRRRVAVVGGGLAGLAATLALSDGPFDVELFESRRQLGGRAASFRDPATGALVDFCQHVSLGCCTNLADFCRRTGIADQFTRERTLNFIGPDGERSTLTEASWLPAPLHLLPSLLTLRYLTIRERISIVRSLLRLARVPEHEAEATPMDAWLAANGQSPRMIERFWAVVIVSALGDTVDRVSVAAARKVFVDAFMANRTAYEVLIPKRPLSELFHHVVGNVFRGQGVSIHTGSAIERIARRDEVFELQVAGSEPQTFHDVLLAVPWRVASDLVDGELQAALPELQRAQTLSSSPITGVHLWLDSAPTPLPHAVLVGRLSQWLFNRGTQKLEDGSTAHQYQVVISASHELDGSDREQLVSQIIAELAAIWPAFANAKLRQSKVVTDRHAAFSTAAGSDSLRPPQQTNIPGLTLAGDWTTTGWPATMESAVRSGYLAAESVWQRADQPRKFLVNDLPRNWLVQVTIGR